MGYDRELYQQLQTDFEERRRRDSEELEARQTEIFAKVPELSDVDRELKMTGVKLSKMILSGGKARGAFDALRARQKELRTRRKMLLLENGYPENALSLQYVCGKCRDTGTIGTKVCECYQKRLTELAYESSNLCGKLETQDFEHFDLSLYSDELEDGYSISPRRNMADIRTICQHFVQTFDAPGNSLLFTGRPGVGKTFLSTCIAKEVLQKGHSVIYETAYRIFSMLDEYKFKRTANVEQLKTQLDRLYDCDLLILDDLGAEFRTTYTSAALFDVVNSRLLSGKKCIINTNLTLQELNNQYSERIVSRITGNYTVLKFFGRDIRQRAIQFD